MDASKRQFRMSRSNQSIGPVEPVYEAATVLYLGATVGGIMGDGIRIMSGGGGRDHYRASAVLYCKSFRKGTAN